MTKREKAFSWAAVGATLTACGVLITAGVTINKVDAHEGRLRDVEGIAAESIKDRAELRASNKAEHAAIVSRLDEIRGDLKEIRSKLEAKQ